MQIELSGWKTAELQVSNMTLLNKLTIKNLKLNKKRTVVTIIGILLSVALLTAVASMFFSARASLIYFEKERKGNFHTSFTGVPKEDLKDFKLNRAIESYYVTENLGYAQIEGIQNEYKPYVYVKVCTEEALQNLGVKMAEGRMPEKEAEILVPAHLKSNGGVELKVGDTISLAVGTRTSQGEKLEQYNPYDPDIPEEIIDTRVREYQVVGIMERPSSVVEDYSAPGYTFFAYGVEENMDHETDVYVRYTKKALREYTRYMANILEVDEEAFTALNNMQGMQTMTEEELRACLDKVSDAKYNYQFHSYLIELESGIFSDSTLSALASACVVVVFIIILTSVFCIKNSFDISITEKIRQYGMLSSIGATKKQIKRNVYYEAMVLGAVGIPLGILSGLFAAYVLVHVCNLLMEDGRLMIVLIFSPSWLAILFAIVLGLVTLLLSARKSAVKASRITPIQAIRNSGEIRIKSAKIKSPKWVEKIFGIGGEISYKNVKRSKKKYRTTVISITVCVAVFIALSSFINLAFDAIQAEFGVQDYNLSVSYQHEQGMRDYVQSIRELDGVKECTGMGHVTVSLSEAPFSREFLKIHPDGEMDTYTDENGEEQKRDSVSLKILDEEAFKSYAKKLGQDYNKIKEKGILLNEVYTWKETEDGVVDTWIPKYTFQKGDVIHGQIEWASEETGKILSEDIDVELALITDTPPLETNIYNGSADLYVSESYGMQFVKDAHYQEIFVESEDADETQKEMEELFQDVDVYINNINEYVKTMRSMYLLIAIFLYGFITVIALIGVTNIFNTITTNMNLRRREFAMLKSVGMTKKEFNRMILLESFFYCIKSLVIGILVGCVLSYLIYRVLMSGDTILPYRLPMQAILFSLAAVFVLITAIMRYSIGKINSQNTIETIRNENI